jgi:hypothetical protein
MEQLTAKAAKAQQEKVAKQSAQQRFTLAEEFRGKRE